MKHTTLMFCIVLAAALAPAAPPAGLVLIGGRIYPAPGAPPILSGSVVVRDGRIAAAGPPDLVAIPAGAERLDCAGASVAAGFWNCHVHFTEPKWEEAGRAPAARLDEQLQEMLTRYGFTTVVDTGSLLENTLALRRRIEAGECRGPRIFTTGPGFVARGGSPYYLKPVLLPEIETPEQAAAAVRERLAAGADAIKLFTASWATRERAVPIPVEVVRGAASEAHRQGKLVLAHPSDITGLSAANEGVVDILAHAIERPLEVPPELLVLMTRRGTAVIPTVALFGEKVLPQVKSYSRAGLDLLFGTDVGYRPEYETRPEFELLARAGLGFDAILATLTTAPAARFRLAQRTGRVAPGLDADLVVLDGDPASDARAFAQVRYTIRAGKVIYHRP